jgi:hypothetical protein
MSARSASASVIATSILAVAFALGCGGGGNESKSKSGSAVDSATAKTISDTEVMREAEAAANQVIRSIGDCEAVSAVYADTIAKLDDVEARVQTQAGRTTLQTLRRQVTTAGEACGIR